MQTLTIKNFFIKNYRVLVFLAISLFLFTGIFNEILFHPNDIMFTSSGDGLKNYYVFAYHVANDSYPLTFEGMNYPYGEHLFYASGNPLFSNLVKPIYIFFPGVVDYSVAIINLFILFSFYAVSLFSYLILRKYKVHFLIATFGAITIMLLCPQVNRFGGHLNLSFCTFFLINWYILLIVERSNRKLPNILFLIFNVSCFIIHPYLGLMNSMFNGIYFLGMFLFKKYRFFTLLKRGLLYALLPTIIFFTLLNIVHYKADRNPNPAIVENSKATLESVFLPRNGLQRNFLEEKFNYTYKVEFEEESAIGSFALISIIIVLLVYVVFSIKNRQIIHHGHFLALAISACFLLFFAFGSFEKLLEATPLANFRTLGRFAWVFFYVSNILSIVIIYRLTTKIKWFALLFLLFIPNLKDGYEFVDFINDTISGNDNFLKTETPKFIDYSNYQGILTLPHFATAHENFGGAPNDQVLKQSMLISFKEKLPIVSNFLSRGSFSETKKGFQIYGGNHIDKKIQYDLNSKKPFLVMYKKNDVTSFYSQDIVGKLDSVGNQQGVEFGSISFENLFNRVTYTEKLKDINRISNPLIHLNFESEEFKSANTLFGEKVKEIEVKVYTNIASIDTAKLKQDQPYVVSFWINNCVENGNHSPQNIMFIIEVKRKDKTDWMKIINPRESVQIQGCKTLVQSKFSVTGDFEKVNFVMVGYEKSPHFIKIDELQLRHLNDTTHIPINDNSGLINNAYYYNN